MVTRRRFGEAIVALTAALGFSVQKNSAQKKTYGRMDVERWQRDGFRKDGASVLVDGLDITNDCIRFDDVEGWADVLLRDEHGRAFLDPTRQRAAQRRVHGCITVDYKAAHA